jgi:hypothetical protein
MRTSRRDPSPPSSGCRLRYASAVALALAACTTKGETVAPAPRPPASASASSALAARDAGAAVDAHDASLARDVEQRTRQARERFGAGSLVEVVDGSFVLVDVPPGGPLYEKAKALLVRAVPALQSLFGDDPRARALEAVTVLLFSNGQAFRTYVRTVTADETTPYGVYLPGPHEIAVDLSLGPEAWKTMTHEVVHVLMDARFPEAREWFREGLASYFEEPVFAPDGSIRGAPKNWRNGALLEALHSPSERENARLERVFGLTHARFVEGSARDVALNYALARSACAWMDAKGKLWPFYRAYREAWSRDESGKGAFTRVMGGTPEEEEKAWRAWVEGG